MSLLTPLQTSLLLLHAGLAPGPKSFLLFHQDCLAGSERGPAAFDLARPSGVCPWLALPSASSTSFHFSCLLLFRSCFHHHHFTEPILGQELSAGANRDSQSCPFLLGNEQPESEKLFSSRSEPKRTWHSNHTTVTKESIFHNILCGQNFVLGA